MYNPYDNNPLEHKDPQAETQRPVVPNYGYTAQSGTDPVKTEQPGAGQPGASPKEAPQPAGAPSVTYHTGPVHAGSAYIPQQGAGPYPASGQAQPTRTAYTWNPADASQPGVQGGAPQPGAAYAAPQRVGPYYPPVQPPRQKKSGKRGGKFALKILAAVLCCAVVSFGSMGVFALMIQNGVINIQSTGESNKTAAFTIYKQAESTDQTATPTVTGESMTAQEAAKKVTPSVVCVQNYQITQQGGYAWFFGYGYETDEDPDAGLAPAGEGSGIVISKDGYIVTNQHVVDGATNLKVVTSEGLTYEAELVGEDTQTDLAVIKVDTDDELTPAEFGSSQDLEVADEVMAIGNPGGLQLNSSVTFGRISALNRQVTNSDTGYSIACIQTDAAINPGNSGGALVDMNGRVVGINSSKIVATGYEGLGFAIPADTVQPIVSDLMEYGYVKDRPSAGFSGQYVERLMASFYGMNVGYYVTQVTSGEAERAGLQRGDMITAIDDTQVTSGSTIAAYISDKKPGDTVTLTVERTTRSGSQSGTIELTLSENTGKSTESAVSGGWQ